MKTYEDKSRIIYSIISQLKTCVYVALIPLASSGNIIILVETLNPEIKRILK